MDLSFYQVGVTVNRLPQSIITLIYTVDSRSNDVFGSLAVADGAAAAADLLAASSAADDFTATATASILLVSGRPWRARRRRARRLRKGARRRPLYALVKSFFIFKTLNSHISLKTALNVLKRLAF